MKYCEGKEGFIYLKFKSLYYLSLILFVPDIQPTQTCYNISSISNLDLNRVKFIFSFCLLKKMRFINRFLFTVFQRDLERSLEKRKRNRKGERMRRNQIFVWTGARRITHEASIFQRSKEHNRGHRWNNRWKRNKKFSIPQSKQKMGEI